jgi:hypothetical protein
MLSIQISVEETKRSGNLWNLDGDLNGEITEAQLYQFTKATLIQVAKDVLVEEQARGFDKNPRTRVDNILDKNIEEVKPLGKIEFLSKVAASDSILDIYNTIIMNSKIYSGPPRSDTIAGLYQQSNVVTFNGAFIASNLGELQAWLKKGQELTDKDTIRFFNTVPYARRLEFLGVKASGSAPRKRKIEKYEKRGKGTTYAKAPNGTYFLAFMSAKRKYTVLSDNKFKFEFLTGSELGIVGGKFKSGSRFGGRKKSAGRPYLYPTIVLRLSERGMK